MVVVAAGGVVDMGFGGVVIVVDKRPPRPTCCALSRAFHLRSKSLIYRHFLHDHGPLL